MKHRHSTPRCNSRRTSRGRNEELRSTEEGVAEAERREIGEGSEKLQGCHGAGGMGLGAITLVLDLANTCERAGPPLCWIWTTHFIFPRKILLVFCSYFEHRRRV